MGSVGSKASKCKRGITSTKIVILYNKSMTTLYSYHNLKLNVDLILKLGIIVFREQGKISLHRGMCVMGPNVNIQCLKIDKLSYRIMFIRHKKILKTRRNGKLECRL